eukprot:scaffold18324_cov176-Amphora_coffeaeformis.AAC.12
MSAMTEATRLVSNTAKSRQNMASGNDTNKQQPLGRKKRFWVLPLKAFRRRFRKTNAHTLAASTAETIQSISQEATSSVCESALTGSPKLILETFDPFQDLAPERKEPLFLDDKPSPAVRPNFPFETSWEEAPKLEYHADEDECAVSLAEKSLPREVVCGHDYRVGNSTITMTKPKPKGEPKKLEPRNEFMLFNILPKCFMFDGDPSQFPVLEVYDNLLDDSDEETVAILETIDTYLKEKYELQRAANNGEDFANLSGFEYHKDKDFLRAHVPGFSEDDVSFIPEPEDVVWTEFNKGCGGKSAELLADGFVLLPERLFGNFFKKRYAFECLPDSPNMVSSTDCNTHK